MISIIVPVLNEAKALPGLLEDLSALPGDKEVIVVDGGSTDRTRDIARSRARVRLITSRRGRGTQIARGADVSTGTILMVLHADCRVSGDALLRIERECANGREWGWLDIRYEPDRPALRAVARALNWQARLFGTPVGEHCIFATREAWGAAGGCPRVPLMEDVLLARRLRKVGPGRRIGATAVCSSRRYEAWGILGMGLCSMLLLGAFHLGVPPHRLARFYTAVR